MPSALCRWKEILDTIPSRTELSLERGKRGSICVWLSANDHVDGRDPLQHTQADNLAKSSLEPIPLDDGASVLGNDEAYARVMQKGSDHSELQMLSPNSLPLT